MQETHHRIIRMIQSGELLIQGYKSSGICQI